MEESSEPYDLPVVAFLGPLTSYSHQATKSVFGEEEWALLPTTTIKEVFDAVQTGPAKYGVVPFENSTHGTVTFTLDSLADRQHAYGDVQVCGEVYLDVHHFLLGRRQRDAPDDEKTEEKPRGTPLTSLSHMRRVYSHPQALGQSAAFLARHLRGVETVEVSSTSRAAELVAREGESLEEGEGTTSAAVAGEMAAAAYGLDILARCIEDREDNTTRFFVLGNCRGDNSAGHGALPRALREAAAADNDNNNSSSSSSSSSKGKSLVSFTVPHRSPGALADALECFRRYGLNLTSINSLPSLIQPFQYLFFVEFEGSKLDDPLGKVELALKDVAETAQNCRWWGSWTNRRRVE